MKRTKMENETIWLTNYNTVIVKRGYVYFEYDVYEEAKTDDQLTMNRIYYGQWKRMARKLSALN